MTSSVRRSTYTAQSRIAGAIVLAFTETVSAQTFSPAYVPGSQPEVSATFSASQQATAIKLRRAWIAAGHGVPEAVQYPKITAVTLLTPILTVGQAPSAPALQLSYTTGPAGLHELQGRYLSPNSSQQMSLDYIVPTGTPPSTSGTIVIQQPVSNSPISGGLQNAGSLGPYAEPGSWILVNLFIFDNAGNSGVSGKAATLTVVNNGTPDVTAPTVSAGSVLTPTVSRSSPNAAFVTTLTVSDDLSGVQGAYVSISKPPGVIEQTVANLTPGPLASGTITNALPLPSNAPLGTWHIVGYQVCDVAGNCVGESTPARIMSLFGTTTFTVTP